MEKKRKKEKRWSFGVTSGSAMPPGVWVTSFGEPNGAGTDIAGAPQRWLLFSSLDTGKVTFLEPSELGRTMLLVEAGNDIWNLAGVLWRWRLLLSLSQL